MPATEPFPRIGFQNHQRENSTDESTKQRTEQNLVQWRRLYARIVKTQREIRIRVLRASLSALNRPRRLNFVAHRAQFDGEL